MTASDLIRLFVVDDHPIVRAGLRSIEAMSSRIRIVGDAGVASEALTQIKSLTPDVVLLDIRLHGTSGIDLCRQIKKASRSRILILTSYANEQLILSALEAGVDGYLLKENDTTHLINAILDVYRGEVVFDPEVTRHLSQCKRDASGKARPSLACLSAQERRLLAEVAKGKTDKETATELGLSAKTVRNYLDRIFNKLGVHTRTEAATLYIRAGERVWD